MKNEARYLPVPDQSREIEPAKEYFKKEKEGSFLARLLRYSRKQKPQTKANCIHIGRVFPVTLDPDAQEKDYYLHFSYRGQHFGCFGTTGIGKTRLIMHMVVQDILAGLNVFVGDPKGDPWLFAKIVEAATAAGRLDEIIYINPIFPDISTRLNLLAYFYSPDELVDHIVSGVKAREEYFINVAHEVSLSIILALLAKAREKGEKLNVNFYEIKKWCSYNSLAELKESLEHLRYSDNPNVRRLAEDAILTIEQILSSPQDFFAKVSSSLRTVLTALSSSSVGEVVGKATYNEFIRRLEEGEGVIVFCNTGSLLARRSAHIVGKVLLSMIQSAMGRFLATNRAFDPPLSIYLDEGHNFLYIGIEELFNKGRGAGVWINFFTQSLAQIEEYVGPTVTKAIVDNISTWVFMRVNHEATAKHVERSSPIVIRHEKRYIPGSGGIMVPVSERKEHAVTADQILRMPKRRFVLKSPEGEYYYGEIPFVPDPRIIIDMPEADAKGETLHVH